jgi:hypothetical protein
MTPSRAGNAPDTAVFKDQGVLTRQTKCRDKIDPQLVQSFRAFWLSFEVEHDPSSHLCYDYYYFPRSVMRTAQRAVAKPLADK